LVSYLDAWRKRWAGEARADAEARARAQVAAKQIARLLREKYGARRIVLIGSLARGDFRVGSDIDLVVEGLDSKVFYKAGADAERTAAGHDVDLVPLESASPALLDQMAREGEEIL